MENLHEIQLGTPGSDNLLSEILSVLQRIDGHLQTQQTRINDLDARITTATGLTGTASDNQSLKDLNDHHLKLATTLRPFDERRTSTFPTSPSARILALGRETNSRTGSVQSTYSIATSLDHFGENKRYRQALAGEFTERGSLRKILSKDTKNSVYSIGSSNPVPETEFALRRGTLSSLSPPPMAPVYHGDSDRPTDDLEWYTNYPPPESWIVTRTHGRRLEVKFGNEKAQTLWKSKIGDSYTIPPDGRVEMTFQRHILERLDETQVTSLLETLQDVSDQLEYRQPGDPKKKQSPMTRGSFTVTDYEFDPNYEVSVAEYRAEIPIGKFRDGRIKHGGALSNIKNAKTAPWKRIIVGRNRRHVTTTCVFHITFYELVDLAYDDELEGEIWRSGKVHSDNPDELEALFGVRTRRIRESACTTAIVSDPDDSQFWTMLYMCPDGFEVYDKTHEFEHYDTISSAIKGRNAAAALEVMIEFSIRIVIRRWKKIIKYFTWLLGHRNTLLDPDTHDSLLFDDDSFSRSRRYFWAINYLAEMETSIRGNIIQLEKFAERNKALREQSNQLLVLRERIRGQRDEAIALRDGLFNASAVMESRASTRLNENIKLLTFVSIFFLPLSFCMSVWSVNNTIFSLKALVIVAILAGLSTYLLVFNLNNVVHFCSRLYSQRKYKLIDKMNKDPDRRWKEQGQLFTTFQPKYEKRKPSEWILGLFLLHRIFGNFHPLKSISGWRKDRQSFPGAARGSAPFPSKAVAQSKIHAENQTNTAAERRKKSSIKDAFVTFSQVFRRGALASQAAPTQHLNASV